MPEQNNSIAKYNTRVILKHDTKANWDKATNFIPLNGELIVYTDLNKIKIGDGTTSVVNLPFALPTKADIGLSNVDNTSDQNKPISSAVSAALNTKLSSSTKYAGSSSVGGAANSANKVNITRPGNVLTAAGNMAIHTEEIYFLGSDGLSNGAPVNYCIINAKKGSNHRTILDCYALQTGDHYINGCMYADNNTDGKSDEWTGWILQPNPASLETTLSSAKSYTDTKVANLINGAPTTLDTLKEIADAMQANSDVVEALEAAVGNKVDKVTGKGLSTNDYTTSEKTKLSGIATGAQVNQNAFANVVAGSTTIAADSQTDSLTIAAGTGISVAGDATNDKVTITNSGATGVKGSAESSYRTGNVNITAANIGLGNVNNTSDASKPVSVAQQQAINTALESAKTYADNAVTNAHNYKYFTFQNNASTLADAPTDGGNGFTVNADIPNDTLKFIAGNNLINFNAEDNSVTDTVTVIVNADPVGSADAALEDAKAYTDTALSNIDSVSITKIWESANTIAFHAQTIPLDWNDYDLIAIVSIHNGTPKYYDTILVPAIVNYSFIIEINNYATGEEKQVRTGKIVTDGIDFAYGKKITETTTTANQAGVAIPMIIYGIKGVSE